MKRICTFLLIPAILLSLVFVVLGTGDKDPTMTLSYLEDVLTPQLEEALEKTAKNQLNQTYQSSFIQLSQLIGAHNLDNLKAQTQLKTHSGDMVLKKGDVLTLASGAKVLYRSGQILTNTSNLIDVSTGVKQPSNKFLQANTLYMMGFSDSVGLSISSEIATLHVDGAYTLAPSNHVDYQSLGDGLHAMGLFKGTNYGYSLDTGVTRAQGLVMFLRILGMEEAALNYTGTSPFQDVPASHWADPYISYAHEKGLTSGISATLFAPDSPITAQHYTTFLMRALQYEEGTDFSYVTALTDVVELGLFNSAEMKLTNTFLRSDMVYLSYYALFAMDQGSDTMLFNQLISQGVLTKDTLTDGICKVVGTRVS